MKPLSKEQLEAIYDILVRVCGAPESDREQFVMMHLKESFPTEWRFMGTLGFGGKFWRNCGRLYVNCYSEDETKVRSVTIKKANEELAKIYDTTMERGTGTN